MAINFTVAYTFAPNTTISSSEVNTNFSDEANVWIGLEAGTKSFALLKVDTLPTTSTEVTIKSYVDKLNAYRRPVLQFASVTTVAIESGLDGTSGDIPLLFPDGTLRTETSTTRTTFNITRNAVLTTAGAQSGLTGATSEAATTWYALYGVKVTDSSTQWVTVGSTVLPLQANFATLNTAYGANGWVYLGLIRNGTTGATLDILNFVMSANTTIFSNVIATGNGLSPNLVARGVVLATTAGAATLTYTYSAGTGTTNIPGNIGHALYSCGIAGVNSEVYMDNSTGAYRMLSLFGNNANFRNELWTSASAGILLSNGLASSIGYTIIISGFTDSVLGIGANPVL